MYYPPSSGVFKYGIVYRISNLSLWPTELNWSERPLTKSYQITFFSYYSFRINFIFLLRLLSYMYTFLYLEKPSLRQVWWKPRQKKKKKEASMVSSPSFRLRVFSSHDEQLHSQWGSILWTSIRFQDHSWPQLEFIYTFHCSKIWKWTPSSMLYLYKSQIR